MVQKRGPGTADDGPKGEEKFSAAPDTSAKDPYKGMLSKADADKNYPRRAHASDWKSDYWIISCQCLEVDGDPLTALGVVLTLPKGEYAAALKNLRKNHGKKNVALTPPADAPPAARKPPRARG